MAKRKIVSPIKKVNKEDVEQPQSQVQEEVQENVEEFKDFRDYLNVFEFNCILPGSQENIRFKPLTVAALKKVLAYEGDTSNAEVITSMFDDIFKTCVLNSDFDPHDLLIFDRYQLLLEIRKKTKGEKTEFEFNCPKCKSQSIQKVDYEDIETLPVPKEIDYIIPLTDQLSISMRYLTRRDELRVFKIVNDNTKGMKPNQKEGESALFLEAMAVDQIITPQGPQEGIDIYDKKFLLEELPQPLYEKVGEWHEKYKFGPQLEIKIKCPHCEHKIEQNISDQNFF